MKTTKLLIIALVLSVVAASTATAQSFRRTNHWNHHGHHRSHSSVYFGIGLGYPFGYGYGYGYPYYSSYPYRYGYYGPRATVYVADRINDDATVAAVQRRLARGGYYRGSIDGVIGPGTRSAVAAFERKNGLPVDGVIDRQLLRTMGLS